MTDPPTESKFLELYKFHNKVNLQERRRLELLMKQKEDRSKAYDDSRNIQTILQASSGKFPPRFSSHSRTFRGTYHIGHRLQLSEWLKEKPLYLDDWLLVPCPKGKRCMVVACNGCTEVFTKSGNYWFSFASTLPGDKSRRSEVSILDCIFVREASTFYVLDVLALGRQEYINCEAQCRFFVLHSKISENDYHVITSQNNYAFKSLSYFSCEDYNIFSSALMKYPMWEDENVSIDGFLFYHREASYTFGKTPLVGWLYGFMIPEVFEMPVHSAYDEKPDGYIDYHTFILEFEKRLEERKVMTKGKARQPKTLDKKSPKLSSVDKSRHSAMELDSCNDDESLKSIREIIEKERQLETQCAMENEGEDLMEENTSGRSTKFSDEEFQNVDHGPGDESRYSEMEQESGADDELNSIQRVQKCVIDDEDSDIESEYVIVQHEFD